MTKISVIIPTHDRAPMLRRAIDSARHAGEDVEVIVVDDASTDETESMCRDLIGIVYIRMSRNVGLARARNAGIAKSTGEYIAFLDDDDLRLRGSLDAQAKMLERDKSLAFVYGQVHVGDPETCRPTGKIWPKYCRVGDIFWELVRQNFIHVPSVVIRKRQMEAIGGFALDVPGTEDWDAWLRLAAISRVGAVQEPVAIYRDFSRHSGQMSSYRPRMMKSSARTQARALRSPRALTADEAIRQEIRSNSIDAIWSILIGEGDAALSERNLYYAAMNYIAAIQIHPKRAARLGTIKGFIRSLLNPSRDSTHAQ